MDVNINRYMTRISKVEIIFLSDSIKTWVNETRMRTVLSSSFNNYQNLTSSGSKCKSLHNF
jgi:hypothetical protein